MRAHIPFKMTLLQIFKNVTNSVSMREEFNKEIENSLNEKFERKLQILAAAGMRVMVLKLRDLERIKETIV